VQDLFWSCVDTTNKAKQNKTTKHIMGKTTKLALETPASAHSLEERRAVSADITKLVGHKLKKELADRVDRAKEHRKACYAACGDLMFSYNEAVNAVTASATANLVERLRVSFDLFDALADEDDPKFAVTLKVEDTSLLFGLQEMPKEGYYYLGESALLEMRKKHLATPDIAKSDLVVPFEVTVLRGSYTEMVLNRKVSAPVTPELEAARIALVEAAHPYVEACDALAKCEDDLKKLPSQMEEVEMQTTARRIVDMGGSELLDSVLDSADKILSGNIVDGLRAALPDYSNAGSADAGDADA
jgi:hypothetical protein